MNAIVTNASPASPLSISATAERLRGVVAIIRLRQTVPSLQLLEALVAGGVTCVEITLPTPGSLEAVQRWADDGRALVGTGTVRDVEGVAASAEAGAAFVVTPTFRPEVIAASHAASMPIVCGAFTPTEIDAAHHAGADLIKVFPIAQAGGVDYLKAVSAPLDDIAFCPTGGIGLAETTALASFGCAGVGIGSNLVDEKLVAAGDWAALTSRASEFVAAWEDGTRG